MSKIPGFSAIRAVASPLAILVLAILQSPHPASGQNASTQPLPATNLREALRRCASPQGCSLQLPQESTLTGEDPAWLHLGDNIISRAFLYPPNTHLHDTRSGHDISFASNVGGQGQGFAFFTRFDRNLPSDGGGPPQANIAASYFAGAPGTYAYGSETVMHNILLNSIFSTKGIAQAIGSVARKYGTGDFGGQYAYDSCMGGAINGDDEGCNANYAALWEGFGDINAKNPHGTIPIAFIESIGSSGAGHSSLKLKLTDEHASNNALGAGRFAVLVRTPDGRDAALHTFTVTAHNDSTSADKFGSYTVAEPAPVSAVWGRSTAPIVVPNNNDVPQTITATIAIDPLSPEAATGYRKGIACMWGWRRNERVEIVEAGTPAAGSQALTLKIRQDPGGGDQPHQSPYFFQDAKSGGLCQTVGRISAYDEGAGLPTQNVPLMGAVLLHKGDTVSHTVVYNFNWVHGNFGTIGGLQEAMPITLKVKLKRVGNAAIIVQADQDATQLNLMPNVKIVDASDPTFDTSATSFHAYPDGLGYESKGPNTSPVTATVIANSGRNLLKVYSAAEIIAVADPDAESSTLGDFVALEPNSIPWPVHGTVDFPAHHSVFLQMSADWLHTVSPGMANGKVFIYDGPSINAGFSAIQLVNYNPASKYVGSGGLLRGPDAFLIGGPHQTIFDLGQYGVAPLLPNGNVTVVGCVLGDCSSSSASFNMEQVSLRSSHFIRQFDQYNNRASMGFQNGERLLFTAGQGLAINANLSMEGRVVKDLADPVQPTDAVNLKSMNSAITGAVKGYSGPLTLSPSCTVTVTNGLITGKTGC
ncbi:hypothetical protein [Granulicella tundricola]|uniref:Uncharacterized protein n=1 Tax=Granulicella tundricola (strain ATCC BAA-1859 / DSM 23138 / MP5ACTX9) TaxID=1198114 RepID=E8WZ66_GRATM|nr:hypothetical protein [Granulicella tundricola]ADW67668.1 hypothetical protein AciX9_0597 [Granulicella tundricola MP5ACTX9]